MAFDGFISERPAAPPVADGPWRRRWNRAAPRSPARGRRGAPSRRFASAQMAPAAFLGLIGCWAAAIAVLVVIVLVLRAMT
jgi:hypothetical protein